MLGACLFASLCTARQGLVETRDGHILEGHIRFESNLVVVANAAKELLAFVELTNLAEITFRKELSAQKNEAAPVESLLAGFWQDEDVGSVELAGHAQWAGSLLRLHSSGTNIYGQSDSFHFVFREIHGDSEMIARVVQVQYSAPWAKAGLMMRESLAADSRNVLLAVTPLRLGVFQWREAPGAPTAGDVLSDVYPPHWVKLKREGNTFTASKSKNGRQWSLAGRITIPMPETIFVGMAGTGVAEGSSKGRWVSSNRSLFDGVREAPFLVNDLFTPLVQLQSGSSAVGRILFANEKEIQLAGKPSPLTIPNSSVARILFQWLTYGQTAKLRSGRPGVLLTSGEFVEGDFKGIEKGQVKISSVLLGLRSFDLNSDLIAVALRKPTETASQYEIKTVDGSVWVGQALQIENDQLVLQEHSLGPRKIPIHELLEVRRRTHTG